MALVEFVNALGTWVEEALLKRVHKAPSFSIIPYEYSDVTTMEELTIFVVGWRVVDQKNTSLECYP